MDSAVFSIVVATYNRAPLLGVTLDSLIVQKVNVPYEIVVVDNNSTDETPSVFEKYQLGAPENLRYVFEQTQGLSAARNAGVHATRGDVVVFVDDDIIALPGWLQALASAYQAHPEAACVGGRVLLELPKVQADWFDSTGLLATYLSQLDHGSGTMRIEYPKTLVGANFSVRRDALLEAGMFRTELGRIGNRLLSGEDGDLVRRLRNLGKSIYYCGEATVLHLVPQTRLEKKFFRRRAYWQGRTSAIASNLPWRVQPSHPVRDSIIMIKDSIHSVIQRIARNPRRAFDHEIAAWKRLGYLHQFFLTRIAARRHSPANQPRTTLLRKFIEAVAVDAAMRPRRGTCLVLAPHPDDEVLACGGTIVQKVREGEHVAIGFLTDGRNGASGSPAEAIALRQAEAVRAAEILGVPREMLFFLGYEDGRLMEALSDATARVRQLLETLRVSEIFVPYRREFHADHQAAWAIADACRQNGMSIYEYPIWYGPWLWRRLMWTSRLTVVLHLLDLSRSVKVRVTDVIEVKRLAFAAYRSQVSALKSQPWGTNFLANFFGDYELFFQRSRTVVARDTNSANAARSEA